MESEPQLLLSLLAVRLHGDTPSPKLDVFKKLKIYVEDAKKHDLLKDLHFPRKS